MLYLVFGCLCHVLIWLVVFTDSAERKGNDVDGEDAAPAHSPVEMELGGNDEGRGHKSCGEHVKAGAVWFLKMSPDVVRAGMPTEEKRTAGKVEIQIVEEVHDVTPNEQGVDKQDKADAFPGWLLRQPF